eukprot:CAMPEP_0197025016 /NCGR_PEP_ID=MMETSP1384-20130603/5460_1 /TAXON_ID=29189 /ORGANISM="Ammonia sp." /LENGTH=364 /DNA_ID=CAMNT_0042453493 /DNA_START=131 /DNA_END=1225 /DNA_ORIENTATION=-
MNNVDCNHKFVVKIPLFFFSYSFHFTLSVNLYQLIGSHEESDEEDIIVTHNEWTQILSSTSPTYCASIPSILIEPHFEIGQHVQYCRTGGHRARSGVILDINRATELITIKTDASYCNDIVYMDSKNVLRFPTQTKFVVDVTNRIKAEAELILQTKPNKGNVNVYSALSEYLYDFYYEEMYEIDEDNYGCIKILGNMVATNIYKFLYDIKYHYRIQCIFCDRFLFYDQQWKYHICRQFHEIKRKRGVRLSDPDVQEARNRLGYTCDLCRVELNWYEFVYHCKCDEQWHGGSEDGTFSYHQKFDVLRMPDSEPFVHDFCVTCIYAVVSMYQEMTKYLKQCLKDLNDDCIAEIVSFCCGKVIYSNY